MKNAFLSLFSGSKVAVSPPKQRDPIAHPGSSNLFWVSGKSNLHEDGLPFLGDYKVNPFTWKFPSNLNISIRFLGGVSLEYKADNNFWIVKYKDKDALYLCNGDYRPFHLLYPNYINFLPEIAKGGPVNILLDKIQEEDYDRYELCLRMFSHYAVDEASGKISGRDSLIWWTTIENLKRAAGKFLELPSYLKVQIARRLAGDDRFVLIDGQFLTRKIRYSNMIPHYNPEGYRGIMINHNDREFVSQFGGKITDTHVTLREFTEGAEEDYLYDPLGDVGMAFPRRYTETYHDP